jgi:adenylate cyclase
MARVRLRLSPAIAMALAIAALAGAAGLGAYAAGLLDRLELASVDALYTVRDDPPKASDVAVVAVDEHTLNELQVRWPYRRTKHATIIERLHEAGVRAIAYDMQFTEPSANVEDDYALVEAIDRAREIPIVLATTEIDEDGKHFVLGGEENIRSIGATVAHAEQATDGDGVVRRYLVDNEGYETFASAAAREAIGKRELDVPRTEWIDFAGGPGAITTISFSDVLQNKVPRGALKDKVVVVGATAPTLHDLHATATSGDGFMNGPELQANAIQTLMRGAPLRNAPGALNVAFILLAALAGGLGLALPRRFIHGRLVGVVLGVAAPLVLLGALGGAIVVAFSAGTVLPVTYSLAAFTLSLMLTSALLLSYERHERARQRLRDAFARFVPEQAVGELLASSDGGRTLRGVEREATVMFCDLRGFTQRSQSESAQDVIEFLNRYLAEMSEAILAHGGTVVSFMGDGVMAVFGAPLPQDDHAQRALAAAREMSGERIERFNAWLTAEVGGDPVGLSVGLHSGPVASGTVGSERRLEYAAVGHTTNVAARLEALTRDVGADVLLSDATRALLPEAHDLHAVGAFEVKGVAEPVFVWSLPFDQGDEAHGSGPDALELPVRPAPDQHELVADR